MSASVACPHCGEFSAIADPDTGDIVCSSCGCLISSDNFQHQAFDSDGNPLSSLVHHNSSTFSHRERTVFNAKEFFRDLGQRLSVDDQVCSDSLKLAAAVTDEALGSGQFLTALAAACFHITVRQHGLAFPLSQIADVAGCEDAREVARMADRVVRYLEISSLKQFDSAESVKDTIEKCRAFSALDKSKRDRMVSQGRFLIHCAMKWSLTTGRHPLPVVAAVVVFISEVNGVGVGVEEIAQEAYASVYTSKVRLKELKQIMVKVARILLPWGVDVNLRNVTKHGAVLLKLMEKKASSGLGNADECGESDFGFNEGFGLGLQAEEAEYFQSGHGDGLELDALVEFDGFKLSPEQIESSYKRVLERLSVIRASGGLGKDQSRKRRQSNMDIDSQSDSWQLTGISDQTLEFDDVIQRDVGFDCLPPSYVYGLESRRCRRTRIEAAKCRIREVAKPGLSSSTAEGKELVSATNGHSTADTQGKELACVSEPAVGRKRRKKEIEDLALDWEDCVIELLLLHQVNEDEIEGGHYNRLLDLHVFKSISARE